MAPPRCRSSRPRTRGFSAWSSRRRWSGLLPKSAQLRRVSQIGIWFASSLGGGALVKLAGALTMWPCEKASRRTVQPWTRQTSPPPCGMFSCTGPRRLRECHFSLGLRILGRAKLCTFSTMCSRLRWFCISRLQAPPCMAQWIIAGAAARDTVAALQLPPSNQASGVGALVDDAATIEGLEDLLWTLQVPRDVAGSLRSGLSELGAISVSELTVEDWKSLEVWAVLRPLQQRRLLNHVGAR